MGKVWLYWSGGNGGGSKSSKKGRSGGGGGVADREAATPGCMCAVFQLFDLHHFQSALNQQTSLKTDPFLQLQDEPSTVLKGVEAPRNSLEVEETFMEAASSSSAIKEEENLNLPVGIQIKTTCENRSPRVSTSSSKAKGEDLFSECGSSSPGAKTPNLVARLMGLDLLPESGSPSLSSSRRSTSNSGITHCHMHPHGRSQQEQSRSRQFLKSRPCSSRNHFYDNDITSSVSLPETPRISSARRSDVEHRLSLQINKENNGEELDFSAHTARKMTRRRDIKLQDENRSPGHYARNIVKQVRENGSRKVGLDITNTLKSREQRRDDSLVLLNPKKPSPVLTRVVDDSNPSKETTPSCSPRFRFLDPKNKVMASSITNKIQASHSPRLSPLSPSPENQSQVQEANVLLRLKPQVPVPHQQQKSVQKCKKAGNERFNSRLRKPPASSDAIRNKKEEPFVRSTTTNKASISDKRCKKTPLSNELLPVRKDSSLPLTKLREKQSQASGSLSWEMSTRLSSCASRSYNQEEVTHTLSFQGNIQDKCMCNGTASTSVDEMEFQYIKTILKRTGIDNATPVSLAKWFSPSHPLDPSIFHYIELIHPITATNEVSKVSHRSNRRLIFQLVDELLVEILKPYINSKPWIIPPSAARSQMYGSELIEELWQRIKNFPSANCQVLEDIDALIDTDLRKSDHGTSLETYEQVGERIASEIERDIVESLVHETATAALVFGMAPCPPVHQRMGYSENRI